MLDLVLRQQRDERDKLNKQARGGVIRWLLNRSQSVDRSDENKETDRIEKIRAGTETCILIKESDEYECTHEKREREKKANDTAD